MPAVPYGSEFLIDAGQGGSNARIAGQLDGSFAIVWESPILPPEPDEEYNNEYNEIFGRTFSSTGVLSEVFQVNTEESDPQFDPDIVTRADGSYTVVYSSGVEDSLPGTFIGSQRIGTDGALIGAEVYDPNYSYYHQDPDVVMLPDGRTAVSHSEEDNGELQIYAADGSFVGQENFGYDPRQRATAVGALGGDSVLVVWQGHTSEDAAQEGVEAYGLYGQVRSPLGGGSGPFLIAALPTQADVDPNIAVLAGDRVAVSWTSYSKDGADILVTTFAPFTPTSIPAPVRANDVAAGDQLSAELAVLDTGNFVVVWTDRQSRADDGGGSAIRGQLFSESGSEIDADFRISQTPAGIEPSVAGIGGGDFVVSWDVGDGVKLRFVDSDATAFPTGFLYARAGTVDASSPLSETLSGIDGPNSFYVDLDRESGRDRIVDFGADDVLLTSLPLFDRNGDGIVTFGRNGALDLDGPEGDSDTIAFDGVDGRSGLRYLGRSDEFDVYALASVRPQAARELTLEAGVVGDIGDARKDTFFLDTALGLPGRNVEVIEDVQEFGRRDIFVTTTALEDANGDGIITFGGDKRLDVGNLSLLMFDVNERQITRLEYDGAVARNGVDYFVYSLVGSAAETADLTFT
jgi:hypothetical protein